MSVYSVVVKTNRVERSAQGFPKCIECGSELKCFDHYRKRKPKEVYACVLQCKNNDCQYSHSGWIGHDYSDMIDRVIPKVFSQKANPVTV
jgi:hypothetical protein